MLKWISKASVTGWLFSGLLIHVTCIFVAYQTGAIADHNLLYKHCFKSKLSAFWNLQSVLTNIRRLRIFWKFPVKCLTGESLLQKHQEFMNYVYNVTNSNMINLKYFGK